MLNENELEEQENKLEEQQSLEHEDDDVNVSKEDWKRLNFRRKMLFIIFTVCLLIILLVYSLRV